MAHLTGSNKLSQFYAESGVLVHSRPVRWAPSYAVNGSSNKGPINSVDSMPSVVHLNRVERLQALAYLSEILPLNLMRTCSKQGLRCSGIMPGSCLQQRVKTSSVAHVVSSCWAICSSQSCCTIFCEASHCSQNACASKSRSYTSNSRAASAHTRNPTLCCIPRWRCLCLHSRCVPAGWTVNLTSCPVVREVFNAYYSKGGCFLK